LPSGEDPEYVWLSYPASDPWYLLDPADFDDLVQFLVQEQVVINPTSTSVWKGAHNRRRAHTQEIIEVFSNPALAYVPRRMIAHWLDYSGYDQLSSEESAKVKEGYRKFNLFLKKFVEAGGKVLPGSDPVHSGVPGVGLHHELELLVDAGISPMRAIQAATKDSADFMRKGDQLGTIEPGKLADLIIVREDPLANISNLRKIDLVMKDGEVVDTTYHSHYTNPLPRDESQQTFDKQLITIEIAPKAVAEGSQALTLTVRGKYFRRNATVHFDGVGLVTQFVNATELKATVPRALVTKVGVYPIIVTGAGGPSAVRSKPAHLIVKFK